MKYEDLIGPFLGPGFSYREIVQVGNSRKGMPPERLRPNLGPALIVANTLRTRMLERGVVGLRVNAAYRATGGAKNSQHKFNRALDLDLMSGNYDKTAEYYEEAVRLWCEMGGADGSHPIGLGLYCAARQIGGIRVHIDVGLRARTWQMIGAKAIKPWVVGGRNVPLARYLADRHGWRVPAEDDDHTGAELA
jgi:hypothetical protein